MQQVDLDRHQLAVFLGADLHLRADAVTDQGRGEIFLAGGHPLDRAPGDETGDPGDGLLDGDVGFVTEAAADVRDVHPHVGDREPVGMGQVFANDERADRGRPDFDGLVFFEPDDRTVRFDGCAGAERVDELAFDDHVGVLETLFAVAFDQAVHVGNVGARDGFQRGQVPEAAVLGVDQHRVRLHRVAGIDVDRQRFVRHLDLFQGAWRACMGVSAMTAATGSPM